jgi:protein-disulfide isomerase
LPRIEADVASGVRNGVQGTPCLFINGALHRDDYDPATLVNALRSAAERSV